MTALDPKPANTPENVERIARSYVEVLQRWLTPDEFAAVCRGEENEHDFCDANMALDEAFKTHGYETLPPLVDGEDDGMSQETCDLWNAAVGRATEIMKEMVR